MQTRVLVKGVQNLINSKRAPRAIDAVRDIHLGFDDTLAPFKLVGAELNTVKELMHSVDEKWMKPGRFPPYYKT